MDAAAKMVELNELILFVKSMALFAVPFKLVVAAVPVLVTVMVPEPKLV